MGKIITDDLNLWYGAFHALINVNIAVKEKNITAIIGPSGCGKSTLLRVFNRMNDLVEGVKIGPGNLSDSFSPAGKAISHTVPFSRYSFHPEPAR